MILVTSANGNVDSDMVAALLEAGHTVRAFVRPRTSTKAALRGATIFEGDLFDRTALKRSMQGIRCTVHISPPHHAGEFALGQAVVNAAAEAGSNASSCSPRSILCSALYRDIA